MRQKISDAKVICASCEKEKERYKKTFRNGQYFELCQECWDAALQVQQLLRVDNKTEAAKQRYEWRKKHETKNI